MRLILKSLKQIEYEIYVDSDKIKVKDLKNEIEKLYSFDSEEIKLFYNGTILENQKLLSDYKITENSTIIIMNTKTKKIDNLKVNESMPTKNTLKSSEIKVTTENVNKTNISKILNDNLTIQVNSLVNMGFEKTQVEAAVKAANGRIDLAVEYLNSGIPDKINNNINNNRAKVENEITKELKKQAGVIKMLCKDNKYRIFGILNNIKKNDPGLLRLIKDYQNEFKTYLDSPITEEDKINYEKLELKADEIQKQREEKWKKKKEEKERKEKEKKEKEEQEKQNKIENEDIQKEKKEEKKEEKERDNNIGEKKDDNIEIIIKNEEKEVGGEKNVEKNNENNLAGNMENKEQKREENKNEMEIEEEMENKEKNNEMLKNKNEMKIEDEEENAQKKEKTAKKEEAEKNNENLELNKTEILNKNKEEEKKEMKINEKENIELDKNKVMVKENNDNDNEKNNNVDYNSNNSLINQLTEEEKLIVNKIKSLGNFPLDKVVEAFIVCNKNEELTANYLFEQQI